MSIYQLFSLVKIKVLDYLSEVLHLHPLNEKLNFNLQHS